MSHHNYPPTPASPRFGVFSGREIPEHSSIQDRLHIAETVNSDHLGGGTKHHYQAPSPNVHALQVSSQGEARTAFNLQGYPSSPRRPLPSPRPQPSPRFPQRDRFGEELDRTSNSTSSSNSGSGQYLRSSYYHQPGTPTSVSQDQLERLAVEASNVAGGVLGARHSTPEPFQTGYHSASKSLPGGSNISVAGSNRDRLQTLFSVPEAASTGTTPLPSPSMLPQQFSRSLPRTSSIDSAISSVSAHSLGSSNNNGVGNAAPTPADIQTLIQAAGSAEALIGYMLKEKASAATQNAQLWKLVDKQRAMILGLNKDLERALKDKDRYRKKLKEQLGVVPPMPTSVLAAKVENEYSGAEDHNESPEETYSLTRAESMPLLERQRRGSDLGPDISLARYPVTLPMGSNLDDSRTQVNSSPKEQIPSPMAHNGSFTPESVKTPMGSQHSDSSSHPERGGGGNVPFSPKRELAEELHTPRTSVELSDNRPSISEINSVVPLDSKAAARHHLLKSLGISTSVAPVSGLGKSPLRKAPPAPLALSPLTETRLHTDEEDYDDDDDDDVSIDEIVGYQKKTEGLVIVTEDRSSDDYDRRNSWEHTPIDKKGPELPLPRVEPPVEQLGPHHPGKKGLNLAPPILNGKPHSPGLGDGSGIRQQFARAPLPSPGLPSSPRPVDRPPNSPQPRERPQSPGSPRSTPLSPRLGVAPVPFQPGTPHRLMPQSATMPMRSPLPLRSPLPRGHGKSDSNSSQQTSSDPLANLIILPSAIPSIDCRVVSSRMKPSRASMMPGSKPRISDNDSVFTLGVFARSTGNEILRVEKDVCALPALDVVLRKYIAYNVKVPDRALFTGHAPARIDSRRIAVDEYFAGVLGATMDERAALALCEFFSTEVVDHVICNSDTAGSIKEESISSGLQGGAVKEGYLTKRGKNFGGWKARYFILDGPALKYYEAPGGVHLGQIKLQSAQIGRQSQSQKVREPLEGESDMESQYRHAFLILEPKRKDSSTLVRHVLCAESDAERDEWVEALMQFVDKGDPVEEPSQASQTGTAGRDKKKKRYGPNHKDSKDSQTIEQEKLHALGYEQTTPGPEPARGPTPEEFQRLRNTPSPQNSISSSIPASQSSASILAPSVVSTTDRNPQPKQISAPTNGSVISDLAAWGAKLTHSEQKAAKKRSIWGFRQRSSSADLESHHLQAHSGPGERLPMSRSIFGATLEEAVYLSKPFGVTVNLPAVVYRCIEYLEAKDASNEEGIFRLSGSNVVIKGLREKFNTESDFNLLNNDEYYDVHAVAGLLKLYLRELPTNVLTTDRREEFVKVTEMDDKASKILVLNELVHSLPIENFELLRALSGHLLRIVENSDVNKMTIRNVGIVFSPTLNIPAQVFSMFLHEYKHIFVRPDDNLPDDRDTPRSPFRETHEERRPSVPTVQYMNSLKPLNTPILNSPFPPYLQQTQEPQTPRTIAASYEPSYEQVFTPNSAPDMGFPHTPSCPPPGEIQLHQGGHTGSSSVGPLISSDGKSGKARRRESSMMFMMPRNKSSFAPQAMVMEDSVYE